MPSTYSDLKIELIATGEQSGSWGSTTNTNLGTALQEAITGRANANFASDADLTLGYTDTNGAQVFRNLILNVTSGVSLTTTRNLIVPTIDKLYIVENNTTGSQSIVVKTSAGTGITVPNGSTAIVYADSTNVVNAVSYSPSLEIDSVNIDGGAIDAVTIGTNAVATDIRVDNLQLDANKILSTDTNGNVQLEADGTGFIELRGNTNSAKLRLNCEANSHGVTIASPPHSAGATYELELPDADGTDGQALVTDGAGKLSFGSAGISTGKAIAMAIVFG